MESPRQEMDAGGGVALVRDEQSCTWNEAGFLDSCSFGNQSERFSALSLYTVFTLDRLRKTRPQTGSNKWPRSMDGRLGHAQRVAALELEHWASLQRAFPLSLSMSHI